MNCNDSSDPNEIFQDVFSSLFEIHFPKKEIKRNKNVNPINDFKTKGLLVSRKETFLLPKHSKLFGKPESLAKYKTFRNQYNKVILWGQSRYLPQGKPSDRRNKVQQECNISQTLAHEI